jgi:inner membrane protein
VHVLTHLLASWTLAQAAPLQRRDRAIVTWAGVAPDLDGAGLLIDWARKGLGLAETAYYETWHHALGHGLPAALLAGAIAAALARQRVLTGFLALVSFHLHLLCDLLGSRGSSTVDIWPIPYFAPLSQYPMLFWRGQWPLTGWQNTCITVALLVGACVIAMRRGESPLGLFSRKADAAFVATLRQRFGRAAS